MTTELMTAVTVDIRAMDPTRDTVNIHSWLTHPRAHYWQMTELDESGVRDYLGGIHDSGEENGWVGSVDGTDCFYVETYVPSSLIPQDVVPIEPGDIGMHLLVSPPEGAGVHGLTDRIMAEVIDFCLRPSEQGGRGSRRVLVEPDVGNTAILEKNRAAGFSPVREATIVMGQERKQALVSVCRSEDFAASELVALLDRDERSKGSRLGGVRAAVGDVLSGEERLASVAAIPATYSHLNRDTFAVAQRHLVAKALSEFAHERLIAPVRATHPDAGPDDWELRIGDSHHRGGDAQLSTSGNTESVTYSFTARVLPLEHWAIDEDSITRYRNGTQPGLGAQELIVELQDALDIPENLMSTYLEEIASTLASSAFKLDES